MNENKNIRIEVMVNCSEKEALALYDKIIDFVEENFPSAGYEIIDADTDESID